MNPKKISNADTNREYSEQTFRHNRCFKDRIPSKPHRSMDNRILRREGFNFIIATCLGNASYDITPKTPSKNPHSC